MRVLNPSTLFLYPKYSLTFPTPWEFINQADTLEPRLTTTISWDLHNQINLDYKKIGKANPIRSLSFQDFQVSSRVQYRCRACQNTTPKALFISLENPSKTYSNQPMWWLVASASAKVIHNFIFPSSHQEDRLAKHLTKLCWSSPSQP